MKNYVKKFSQFVNESEYGEPKEMGMPGERGEDLYLDHEAQEKLIARALNCEPGEVEAYHIGSPVNGTVFPDDPELTAAFDSVRDLFHVSDDEDPEEYEMWELKRPGELVYRIDVSAPDGSQEAHYFDHHGMRVVVVEAEDGPFIYVKPQRRPKRAGFGLD